MTALIAAILAGAAIVATTVNVIRDPLDRKHSWPNSLIDAIALVVGVAYAVGWGVNLADQAFALVPALAGKSGHLAGYPGEVLTGLAFGAAATFGAKLFNALGAFQVQQQIKARVMARPTAAPAPAVTRTRKPKAKP